MLLQSAAAEGEGERRGASSAVEPNMNSSTISSCATSTRSDQSGESEGGKVGGVRGREMAVVEVQEERDEEWFYDTLRDDQVRIQFLRVGF
jgi:hypothetical protein